MLDTFIQNGNIANVQKRLTELQTDGLSMMNGWNGSAETERNLQTWLNCV